jgi:hypothetical protein
MTLLAIAATSNIRYFDPRKDQAPIGHDKTRFVECVKQFMPWEHVTIRDDQHRPVKQRREAAAEEFYKTFRNPLVHAGGVRGAWHFSGVIDNWYRAPQIAHVFPGLASWQENEKAIAELCDLNSYAGQNLLEMGAASSIVHTRPLYWCTRKMIEAFAADLGVQRDIERNVSP